MGGWFRNQWAVLSALRPSASSSKPARTCFSLKSAAKLWLSVLSCKQKCKKNSKTAGKVTFSSFFSAFLDFFLSF